MYGAGCKGCNFDQDMANVFIDDQLAEMAFQGEDDDINYIEIDPVTGVMTKFKRAYTMVLSFLCYERSTIRDCSDHS